VVEGFDVVAVVEQDVGGEGFDGDVEGGILRLSIEESGC